MDLLLQAAFGIEVQAPQAPQTPQVPSTASACNAREKAKASS